MGIETNQRFQIKSRPLTTRTRLFRSSYSLRGKYISNRPLRSELLKGLDTLTQTDDGDEIKCKIPRQDVTARRLRQFDLRNAFQIDLKSFLI